MKLQLECDSWREFFCNLPWNYSRIILSIGLGSEGTSEEGSSQLTWNMTWICTWFLPIVIWILHALISHDHPSQMDYGRCFIIWHEIIGESSKFEWVTTHIMGNSLKLTSIWMWFPETPSIIDFQRRNMTSIWCDFHFLPNTFHTPFFMGMAWYIKHMQ